MKFDKLFGYCVLIPPGTNVRAGDVVAKGSPGLWVDVDGDGRVRELRELEPEVTAILD